MDYSAVSGGLELEFYNDIISGTAEDYDITGGTIKSSASSRSQIGDEQPDETENFLGKFARYVGGDLTDDDDESSSAEFVKAEVIEEAIEGGLENSDEEELVVPKEPELEQQEEVEVVEVKKNKKKKKDEEDKEDKEDKEEEDDEVIVPVENSDSELPEDVYVDQQFIEQNVEGGQLEDNFAGEENNYAEQDVELENNFAEVEGGEQNNFDELNAILRGNY